MTLKKLQYDGILPLERGRSLRQPEIAYSTLGTLNEKANNVVWICHALTADAQPSDWWNGIVGPGRFFDPDRFFIVCANIIGSCYGTTGPLSINPVTGQPYYGDFPMITIRDMVAAHELLADHLGVNRIAYAAGGSMGGYQVLEWAIRSPERFERLFLPVTSAWESAWGKAVHATQRWAIESDPTFGETYDKAGMAGMKVARGIGLLSYRNYEAFVRTQSDREPVLEGYKAESYIRYQGEKLARRFNAYSYWYLSHAMDSHHIGRGHPPPRTGTTRSHQNTGANPGHLYRPPLPTRRTTVARPKPPAG